MADELIIIDLSELYAATGTAKIAELPGYEAAARELAGNGQVVVLTGPAPVWLYLRLGHALHGRVKKLLYDSPVTGRIVVYDHDPN